ncbi:alpha-ketoglutarate-dependent dioxygenase alkB homolog 6 [Phymastichus coffea]|uniref:alpha-ketoglutarate-dependent dioxygenase alkB homolog 6 n=1 Tax=Phymastichus coffea TaxID=108790 RepID=UPI00273B2E3C|nr:alpha-ketoglutarate-dependent dioxygenase alkB homolog 6 [Phymastichus coffea]XP_058793839.1 alpha-ketoglutarate-dependent dioxygenase alkB homolog 6 [Phymastichus coffea]
MSLDPAILINESIVKEIPPQVNYIPNFITEEEEKDLIKKVNNAPLPKWTQLSHRRLQNWGGTPHPKGMIAEDIPQWLQTQIDKISLLGIFGKDKTPNHILINEYLSGQGIMAHSDGPLFHPIVTTISCGSHTLLEFYKRFETENIESPKRVFSLLLEPRSLLILQKELYHEYLHSIDEREIDVIDKSDIKNLYLCSQTYDKNQILNRTTRLSLTIRHVPKTSKLKLKLRR